MDQTPTTIQTLIDRQEILDRVYRYARGMDRNDLELALSVFHPDAVDDHVMYVGRAVDVIPTAIKYAAPGSINHHLILNHTVELNGDTAHCETYFLFINVSSEGARTGFHGGRYIDRFERRGGKWAIADRIAVPEWNCALDVLTMPPELSTILAAGGVAARDKTDPSYMRPLVQKRAPANE